MRVVVAKKPYKGSPVGSEIEVSARDARVLIAIGRAEVAQPVAVVVEAEVVVEQPRKRTYRVRNMMAED